MTRSTPRFELLAATALVADRCLRLQPHAGARGRHAGARSRGRARPARNRMRSRTPPRRKARSRTSSPPTPKPDAKPDPAKKSDNRIPRRLQEGLCADLQRPGLCRGHRRAEAARPGRASRRRQPDRLLLAQARPHRRRQGLVREGARRRSAAYPHLAILRDVASRTGRPREGGRAPGKDPPDLRSGLRRLQVAARRPERQHHLLKRECDRATDLVTILMRRLPVIADRGGADRAPPRCRKRTP